MGLSHPRPKCYILLGLRLEDKHDVDIVDIVVVIHISSPIISALQLERQNDIDVVDLAVLVDVALQVTLFGIIGNDGLIRILGVIDLFEPCGAALAEHVAVAAWNRAIKSMLTNLVARSVAVDVLAFTVEEDFAFGAEAVGGSGINITADGADPVFVVVASQFSADLGVGLVTVLALSNRGLANLASGGSSYRVGLELVISKFAVSSAANFAYSLGSAGGSAALVFLGCFCNLIAVLALVSGGAILVEYVSFSLGSNYFALLALVSGETVIVE